MLTQESCRDFAKLLASKAPVPGGGGAAALVAALGIALNSMVINFTKDKKKFAPFKEIYEDLLSRGDALRERLVDLVNRDAEGFEPLAKAYALPANNDAEKAKKETVLQESLKNACEAPMQTIEFACEAIRMHKEIEEISSKIIISDIGVGVQFLKAALNSAYLNVLINLNSISDTDYVTLQKQKAERLLSEGTVMADEIYAKVLKIINNEEA